MLAGVRLTEFHERVVLRFGAASGNAAPFGIATLAAADWTTTFPPLADPAAVAAAILAAAATHARDTESRNA